MLLHAVVMPLWWGGTSGQITSSKGDKCSQAFSASLALRVNGL